jgi:hypothetical protein
MDNGSTGSILINLFDGTREHSLQVCNGQARYMMTTHRAGGAS